MASVAGRPFLEWILADLRRQGIEDFIFCTGYLGEFVRNHFADGSRWGGRIRYSHENTPRGTGGALKQAARFVRGERALVLNGDSFCHFSVDRLAEVHIACDAVATMWVVPVGDLRRFGGVGIGRDGEVTAFEEKAVSRRRGLANGGIYLFERRSIEAIPDSSELSLEREVLPRLVGRGLHAVIGQPPLLDIGTPKSYKTANRYFEHSLRAG